MDPIQSYRRHLTKHGDADLARAATIAEFAAGGIKLRQDFRTEPPTFAERLAANAGKLRILLYRPKLSGFPTSPNHYAYHEFWLEAAVQWGYTTIDPDELVGTPYEGRWTTMCVKFTPGHRGWADRYAANFRRALPAALDVWPEIATIANNIGIYEPEIGARIDDYLRERTRHGE